MLYDVFTTFDWHLALLTWSDVLDETKLCYFFWIEISSLRHMRLGVSSGWCLCVSSTLQEQDQTSITCGRESLSLLHYFSLKISDTSHFPFVWLSCILLWNCHRLQLSIMSYCNIAEWLHNSVLLFSKTKFINYGLPLSSRDVVTSKKLETDWNRRHLDILITINSNCHKTKLFLKITARWLPNR